MGISAYVINVISAVITVEYMDYGFPKKYAGAARWGAFTLGCVAYFLTVTVLNRTIGFENMPGFFNGIVLIGYGIWALEGKIQDFLLAGLLWVLLAVIGVNGIFSVIGVLTKSSLREMLQENCRIDAALAVLVVKFSMGKIGTVFFRKRNGVYEKEDGIVAGAFILMTLMAVGLFWLEAGNLESSGRYKLTIGLLLDETGIIVFLIRLHRRLEKYQKEELENQYRQQREQERLEGVSNLYRVGREINHWRHDMQGKLEILYRMQKNGKYAEVESYMERLYSGLKDYPELPQPTGNEGLDAALIKMIPKCRERGIHFCYVILGKPQKMDNIVLGNLLDNLLCNGMEACRNLSGKREMELIVHSQVEGLEICLANSIGESVLENNPKLISHKREKEKHGFGMENIRHIVEDCEGMYEYWEEKEGEDNRFCQRIFFRYEQGV